jgi:hypothetical protein
MASARGFTVDNNIWLTRFAVKNDFGGSAFFITVGASNCKSTYSLSLDIKPHINEVGHVWRPKF